MRRPMVIVGAGVVVALLSLALVGSAFAHGGGMPGFGSHTNGADTGMGMGMGTGTGMMGTGPLANTPGTTMALADARSKAEQYLSNNGYGGLKVGDVMQFSNQFYAEVLDAQGQGAFELLLSLNGQAVHPEPQSMMWNTTYNLMGAMSGSSGYGMMGSSSGVSGMMAGFAGMGGMMGTGVMAPHHMGSTAAQPQGMMSGTGYGSGMGYHPETVEQLSAPLSTDAAAQRAQQWLDQNRPGVTVSDPTAFPGYVTVDLEQDGKIVGMLSVQSATGAIWEHVWHGAFVALDTAS